MARSTRLKEELELDALIKSQSELRLKEKACADIPRKLALEIKERESTMPPLLEIEERRKRILHEQIISRGQLINIQRDQNRSLWLIFLLLTSSATLIWWGMCLMQG